MSNRSNGYMVNNNTKCRLNIYYIYILSKKKVKFILGLLNWMQFFLLSQCNCFHVYSSCSKQSRTPYRGPFFLILYTWIHWIKGNEIFFHKTFFLYTVISQKWWNMRTLGVWILHAYRFSRCIRLICCLELLDATQLCFLA